MPIQNNTLRGLDFGLWEFLNPLPVTSAAGVCCAGDGKRYIYVMFAVTSFWRYDTWTNGWQQLFSAPAGTFGAATCLRYDGTFGTQRSGQVWGSVWAFISSGTGSPGFYRYDIATNTWTAALSVAGSLPATFGTVARMVRPNHQLNDWSAGITGETVITTSAPAALNATSISVTALGEILPVGTVLNFGTTAAPLYAVLTAQASAAATTLTVSPLLASIPSGAVSEYYNHLWLWGNNATAGYRYNISANTWNATNVAGSAIAAMPAAMGADGRIDYLPGITANTIAAVRANATATLYTYDLSTNTWTTPTVAQAIEVFTTGSTFAPFKRPGQAKASAFIGHRSATVHHYVIDPANGTILPWSPQYQFAYSTVTAQDRMAVMESPEDASVQMVYEWSTNSTSWFRTPLLFDPFTNPAP